MFSRCSYRFSVYKQRTESHLHSVKQGTKKKYIFYWGVGVKTNPCVIGKRNAVDISALTVSNAGCRWHRRQVQPGWYEWWGARKRRASWGYRKQSGEEHYRMGKRECLEEALMAGGKKRDKNELGRWGSIRRPTRFDVKARGASESESDKKGLRCLDFT